MRSFPLLQVVPTRPMEAAPGRWLRDLEQHRTVFGSYEDGRASTSSKSTKTMCSDRGRLRGGMDSSLFWRRRRKHSIWWLPMLVGAARARRRAGHQCERTAAPTTRATRVPLWPVAAVVGSVLRGIRIICNCVGVQATRCDSGTRWQTCLCNRVRAAISSTRRQRLRVGPSITHRQYRYRRRGVCNGLQSPGAGVRA